MSRLAAFVVIFLLALSVGHCAVPSEVAIESGITRLTVDLSDGHALLKSILNKETGEVLSFAPESADFIITTEKGQLKRGDFKVTDVLTNDRVTYVVMDGEGLAVTERFETFESGCVKRSLQLFAKAAVYVEKVSLVNLKLSDKWERTIQHSARFVLFAKGGVFFIVEMPSPSRDMFHSKEGVLRTEYEPGRQLKEGESFETVPAVFQAWTGNMLAGYEKYRDYTYEQSGWREYAAVTASSESPAALTTAYDAYKAVDEDPTTRWRSEKSVDSKPWIEVEMPEALRFNTVALVLDNSDLRPALETPPPFERWRLQAWSDAGWRDLVTGTEAPTGPVAFPETRAAKVRLLVEGCVGRFSVWDMKLYLDMGKSIMPENVCSRFWVDRDVRMPFTYFNSWYIRHPGVGRLQRARGLLTYQTVLPLIPLAAQCGLDNFVLDSGWKYQWYGVGRNKRWESEFPDGEKPFADAARRAGITLAGWHYFFWLEGNSRDHQWRVMGKNGALREMCLLSGYYDFVKNEMLDRIRNDHMLLMKIDGFVPSEECWATDHNHKPGPVRDATWLAFMNMEQEIKRQYPAFRLGIYTWDSFWVKYSELVHTYQDHGGLTAGELAPTHAKMNYMHDREMFNEAYWRYLLRNQIEGSMIIQDKTPDWREEVIGNLAGPTRRQVSTDLLSFSADERNWLKDCLNWSRENARFMEQFKPFFPNKSVKEPWGLPRTRDLEKGLGVDVLDCSTLEGYAHIDGNEGYLFIFNPTFHGAEYSIPVSKELGFTTDAKGLAFQVIYPYFEDLSAGGKRLFSSGETLKGYLPAEKYIVLRVCQASAGSNPPQSPLRKGGSFVPSLMAGCRYSVGETIWDYVSMNARVEPSTVGGVLKAKLTPPTGVAFDPLTVNGKALSPAADGSYEIAMQVPVRGEVSAKARPAAVNAGKKTVVADVQVKGDLLDGQLMLFLMRTLPAKGDRMQKAVPGELDFRLLVNGKPLEGTLGETLDKDWETEKNAGWWIFKLPAAEHKFTVTVECTEKVRPFVVYSALQDTREAKIIGNYSRERNKSKLTALDPEAFLHDAWPEEREYWPVVEVGAE